MLLYCAQPPQACFVPPVKTTEQEKPLVFSRDHWCFFTCMLNNCCGMSTVITASVFTTSQLIQQICLYFSVSALTLLHTRRKKNTSSEGKNFFANQIFFSFSNFGFSFTVFMHDTPKCIEKRGNRNPAMDFINGF